MPEQLHYICVYLCLGFNYRDSTPNKIVIALVGFPRLMSFVLTSTVELRLSVLNHFVMCSCLTTKRLHYLCCVLKMGSNNK